MFVIAAPDHQVPMQDNPDQHIQAAPADPVDVPDTSYYRRRIASGELLRAKAKPTGAKQPAKETIG